MGIMDCFKKVMGNSKTDAGTQGEKEGGLQDGNFTRCFCQPYEFFR